MRERSLGTSETEYGASALTEDPMERRSEVLRGHRNAAGPLCDLRWCGGLLMIARR